MAGIAEDPLVGRPPKEVPLPTAPLVRVLAQVRFTELLVIKEGKNLSEFQERVRSQYPHFERASIKGSRIEVGPTGVRVGDEESIVWRFRDENKEWILSLGSDFVALETTKYKSRADFLNRIQIIFRAVQEIYNPSLVVRMGMRYVDRIVDQAFEEVTKLVRSEVVGTFAVLPREKISHGLTEMGLKAEEGTLMVRLGHLPENASFDPNIVEPIPKPSWIMDLDLFSEDQVKFNADELHQKLETYSGRLYKMFRWIVTDEFLRHYGGEI